MRIILSLTIFTPSPDHDLFEFYVNLIKSVATELKYIYVKHTGGIHRDASRLHYHLITVIDTKDAKIYKIWADKIKRTTAWQDALLKDNSVRISVKQDTETDYNETTALGYALKEYKTDKEMWEDTTWRTGINTRTLYYNVEQHQLVAMRKTANETWEIVKNKKVKIAQDKAVKENKKLQLYEYLDLVVATLDPHSGIHYLVQKTVIAVLKFNKTEGTNFRTNGLKDLAVNYLYSRNKIDEDAIVEYLHI